MGWEGEPASPPTRHALIARGGGGVGPTLLPHSIPFHPPRALIYGKSLSPLSSLVAWDQGTKNRFFRSIFRRKIGFWLALRRKIRGKIDQRKNRGKIGKIVDFLPKNRKKPIFPPKNRDCGARALVQEFLKKYR